MKTKDAISLISKIREKVNRFIIDEMSRQGIEGIATSHGDIIYSLYNTPKLTMAEIAEKIGKDKSTVTALVDKLVKLKYISKERDTEDTRVVFVTLTQKGFELKPVFDAISKEVMERFYKDISVKEKEELLKILLKVYNNF